MCDEDYEQLYQHFKTARQIALTNKASISGHSQACLYLVLRKWNPGMVFTAAKRAGVKLHRARLYHTEAYCVDFDVQAKGERLTHIAEETCLYFQKHRFIAGVSYTIENDERPDPS